MMTTRNRWSAAMLLALGLSLASFGAARAETAIGVVFGHPGNVGLSLRFDRTAIGVAWSDDYLHGTLDWWIKKTPINDTEGKLSWYYGPGIDLGLPFEDVDEFFLAGRFPFGLQFMATPQWELFGELAPGLQLIDETDFYFAGSAGVRFVLGQ